jgi:hypothetical protein
MCSAGCKSCWKVFCTDDGLVKPMYLLLIESEKYTQGVSGTSWRGSRA